MEITEMKKIFSKKIFSRKIIIGLFFVAAVLIFLVNSLATTGFFSKAFDKSLSPGEQYERNVTIRQYYNLTVRVQKETSSTSYLTFDSNDTVIMLKDVNGTEIARTTGLVNGKTYFFMNSLTLDRIATVSALNLGDYADVVDQQANKTFSGTTAYITVKVRYKSASISGFVRDELTGAAVEGVEIVAVDDGADPLSSAAVNSSVTSSSGFYKMQFELNSSKALDVYVKNYEAS